MYDPEVAQCSPKNLHALTGAIIINQFHAILGGHVFFHYVDEPGQVCEDPIRLREPPIVIAELQPGR